MKRRIDGLTGDVSDRLRPNGNTVKWLMNYESGEARQRQRKGTIELKARPMQEDHDVHR